MNVTKHGYKGRKLHKEDCPRMVVAEQREYVEVPAHVRIAEHNDIITDLSADSLLRKILSREICFSITKSTMLNIFNLNAFKFEFSSILYDAWNVPMDIFHKLLTIRDLYCNHSICCDFFRDLEYTSSVVSFSSGIHNFILLYTSYIRSKDVLTDQVLFVLYAASAFY